MINFKVASVDNNVGVIVDALNRYEGSDIWNDVILQYEFEVEPIQGVDAFVMEDEDGDKIRFYYNEGDSAWKYRLNSDFEE